MELLTPSEIHNKLLIEAIRRELPKHYKDDLTKHDLTQLTESKTQHFLWILRECGTHIFYLDVIDDTYGNRPEDMMEAMRGFGDKIQHYYHFCEGQLIEVSFDMALFIAKNTLEQYREEKYKASRAEIQEDYVRDEFFAARRFQ